MPCLLHGNARRSWGGTAHAKFFALATEILTGGPVDSSRLKEIVAAIKARLAYSSREIFHPLRVALAGRVGGGELDRVVLLIDRAARTEGLAPVKTVRTRILEFCAALD